METEREILDFPKEAVKRIGKEKDKLSCIDVRRFCFPRIKEQTYYKELLTFFCCPIGCLYSLQSSLTHHFKDKIDVS